MSQGSTNTSPMGLFYYSSFPDIKMYFTNTDQLSVLNVVTFHNQPACLGSLEFKELDVLPGDVNHPVLLYSGTDLLSSWLPFADPQPCIKWWFIYMVTVWLHRKGLSTFIFSIYKHNMQLCLCLLRSGLSQGLSG